MTVARVAEIWRYPVKSLQGERLVETAIEADGLAGDRLWGLRDDATGKILTARREPRLLLAWACLDDEGRPRIRLPDGTVCTGAGPATDVTLTAWLGRRVTLVAAGGQPASTAEYFADPTNDASRAIEWTMPPGRFVDALPLLVLTTASLRAGQAVHPTGAWDARRFRPNLLVDVGGDGWVEDAWAGRSLAIGSAVVVPRQQCERCTMVTRAQPDLDRDLDVYRALARNHNGTFGMWSAVTRPGTVRAGDLVTTTTTVT